MDKKIEIKDLKSLARTPAPAKLWSIMLIAILPSTS